MGQDQRSILKRRVVDHVYDADDPQRFDHYYGVALGILLIFVAEVFQKGGLPF